MLDTYTQPVAPISDYAIIVNDDDNVAVVKNETETGLVVLLPDQKLLTVKQAVPPGHRFAIREIPAGEFVRQYGQPIGTSLGIEKGEWITHENMSDDVPVVRNLDENLQNPKPDYFAETDLATFKGFRRADGRVGTRNYILIVPTSTEILSLFLNAQRFAHFGHQPSQTGSVSNVSTIF